MKKDNNKVKLTWGFSGFGRKQDSKPQWPLDEKGNRERAVLLTEKGGNPFDSEVDVNVLEAFGIPTVRQAPADGSFGQVVLGSSGYGMQIYVPESMLEDARAILSGEGIEEDFVQSDE